MLRFVSRALQGKTRLVLLGCGLLGTAVDCGGSDPKHDAADSRGGMDGSPGPSSDGPIWADASARDGAAATGDTGIVPDAADAGVATDFGGALDTNPAPDASVDAAGVDAATPAPGWPKQVTGTGSVNFPRLAADPAGHVVMTGWYRGTGFDFGDGRIDSAGSNDVVVVSYTAEGRHRWTRHFGSPEEDDPMAIAIDGQGNVYVTGAFKGTVRPSADRSLVSSGGYDVFVVSYDREGNLRYAQRFGGPSDDTGYGIGVDGMGRCVVSGVFWETVDFGKGPHVAGSDGSAFVLALDAQGQARWSRALGSVVAHGDEVVVDADGRAVAAIRFQGPIDPGNGAIISQNDYDVLFVAYDAAGSLRWREVLAGQGRQLVHASMLDAQGNATFAGDTGGMASVGGKTLTAAGTSDGFTVRLDAGGNVVWARSLGFEGRANTWAIAGRGAEVLVAGGFVGRAMIAGQTLALPAMGLGGAFLVGLGSDGAPRAARGYSGVRTEVQINGLVAGGQTLYVSGTLFGKTEIEGRTFESVNTLGSDLLLFTVAP